MLLIIFNHGFDGPPQPTIVGPYYVDAFLAYVPGMEMAESLRPGMEKAQTLIAGFEVADTSRQ